MAVNRDADASRLAAESIAKDDPTGWFERLYAEAAAGDAVVPWDRDQPNPMLVEWAERRAADGVGRRALVIGCGYGQDAEYIARLGFLSTAFDISPTAIAEVRQRFPESSVEYVVADLLDPPAAWRNAFDLVVESITVQSMPVSVRDTAIANIRRSVAPGGQLIVIAGIRAEGEQVSGPPWPLTWSEVNSFAAEGLRAVEIEANHETQRWRAEFIRSTAR
ncbi:class I SAM-dependent methyltransferase [Nocardia sp. NPDC050408]|uniref:class I SAM-dependent methyltransferase n=1 Tax=unclassified Nocardia TaxID=2637762 RepID=UPI003442714D